MKTFATVVLLICILVAANGLTFGQDAADIVKGVSIEQKALPPTVTGGPRSEPASARAGREDVERNVSFEQKGLPEVTAAVRSGPRPPSLLYDNGPFVNSPGGGPNGTDASILQSNTLGMSTVGFTASSVSRYRLADDFTVIPPGWKLDSVSVFGYQTGADSAQPSTLSGMTLRIWKGRPGDPGSKVVWGDTLTNIYASSYWERILRYTETAINATRPVMRVTGAVGVTLPAGRYWLDWTLAGSLSPGPFIPPITITGDTVTGYAMQYSPATSAWDTVVDGSRATRFQGMPFQLFGSVMWPANVLYDNGPSVSAPGEGPNGTDGSVVQNTTLGMSALGFSVSAATHYRLADDFTIASPGWRVDSLSVFAYQTNADSSLPSTLTKMTLRLWNGLPSNPASIVVWGDTITNVLVSSYWERVLRYNEGAANVARPVMRATAAVGKRLPTGTYWVDWQLTGSLTSGPWAPPITISGDSVTGNAMQCFSNGTWFAVVDLMATRPQGIPFRVFGATLATDVDGRDKPTPERFALDQNYPNPFNPATTIRYEVSGTRDVRVSVYDLLGREVAVLVNERKAPGSYSVRFDANGLASGMYFYRLQAGSFVQTRKMIFTK